ncbi:hypothetical protein Acr_11g0013940 [Actinidia rufa]|uniref:Uncharacterized protein n=1 Tax=Actinidia rufa TaxID=165716 RepID=A0A7J0FEJ2_9ERIC|nr:hypothetical protein Acr_11g0013940 [Actinidia rufa]
MGRHAGRVGRQWQGIVARPWAPRLQKAFSSYDNDSENQLGWSLESRTAPCVNEDTSNVVQTPEQTKLDLLVSPSPLVSWHTDCTTKDNDMCLCIAVKATASNVANSVEIKGRSTEPGLVSPSKPPVEKSLTNATSNCQLPKISCDQQIFLTRKSGNQELGASSTLIDSTPPKLKEPQSTFRMGKHPGESTLKKELLTSAIQETAQRGFLDRLDEVSRDETSPKSLRLINMKL